MINKHTKSKQRVADHGEVFTAEREVNAMLDLVMQETERIESRFFEPACGTGNFLAETLRRKLAVVKRKYKKNPPDYEVKAVLAITSIYGVERLQDNVDQCQARLFEIFDKEYTAICKKYANNETREAVIHILRRNILCGDALALKTPDQNNPLPLVFSEWSMIGNLLKRRDFEFQELVEAATLAESGENNVLRRGIQNDSGETVFMPVEVRHFPPVHYRGVQLYD